MRSIVQGTVVSDYKVGTSMVFIDLSIYNDMIPIEEPTLSVTPPYSENPIELYYIPKGNTVITSISLNRSDTMEELPCGLYKISQSICPHDKLNYNFWYVHTGLVKREVAKLYCDGRFKEAKSISDKLEALEALSYCMTEDSEKKIKTILNTLDCYQKDCSYTPPMKKFIDIPNSCRKNCTCSKCTRVQSTKQKSCNCNHSCNCN